MVTKSYVVPLSSMMELTDKKDCVITTKDVKPNTLQCKPQAYTVYIVLHCETIASCNKRLCTQLLSGKIK